MAALFREGIDKKLNFRRITDIAHFTVAHINHVKKALQIAM
jgi:hypothetical protein